MKPIIEVNNISKKYKKGFRQPYYSLRDKISNIISNPETLVVRKKEFGNYLSKDEFWALKNITFSVNRGEVLGIIGANGAGKSTLLKLLSRITPPSLGEIKLRGKVASLLEVGTGFNPELSGRENISLNGAILGMRQNEIRKKYHEIVEFAGVKDFMDMPVKFYSSGMYTRLAFSVAAHLEPDILIVDEVLAVGDAEFQKRCLGKMRDISSEEGRTVIFVSHNMSAILNLCNRGILLGNGKVIKIGTVDEVIDKYLPKKDSISSNQKLIIRNRDGSGRVQIRGIKVVDDKDNDLLSPDRPAVFKIKLEAKNEKIFSSRLLVAIGISNSQGERIVELHTGFDKSYFENEHILKNTFTLVCSISGIPIKPGIYFLTFYVSYMDSLCDRLKDAFKVEIKDNNFFGTGMIPSSTQGWLLLKQTWRYE